VSSSYIHHHGLLLPQTHASFSEPHITAGHGLVMDGGVPEGHGEASGCYCGGLSGCLLVLLPEAWPRDGDGCCHCEGLSSTLYHWLCAAVHLQPGQRRMDPSSLPFHG